MIKPKTIKNKIFFSFIIFIFLPLVYLQIQNQDAMENAFIENTSSQNIQQLSQIKMNIDNIQSVIFANTVAWERIEGMREGVSSGKRGGQQEELLKLLIERLEILRENIPTFGGFIQANLYDSQGKWLVSSENKEIQADMDTSLVPLQEGSIWSVEHSGNNTRFVFTSSLLSGEQIYGYFRIDFLLEKWMQSMSNTLGAVQNYAIIEDSKVLAETKPSWSISTQTIRKIMNQEIQVDIPYLDRNDSLLINYVDMPSTGWYVVSQFPMKLFLGDMKERRRTFLTTIILFSILFTLITLLLLSKVTRPLNLLRMKMDQVIEKEFKLKLPEEGLEGEVLALTKSFNQTVKDINDLIQRLKVEERLKESIQFQSLLSQMNPHFLLNMLNTVKWLALSRDEKDIAEICLHLGTLLEKGLQTEVELVHLKTELELVRTYIRLQQYRFRDRFHVNFHVEDAVKYALVPKFSLQPLVENAIQHGVSPLERLGHISIIVRRNDSRLLVQVEDDGIGFENSAKNQVRRKSKGIGISNLRKRLQLLFKMGDTLQVLSSEQGTLIQFEIPILISEPYELKEE